MLKKRLYVPVARQRRTVVVYRSWFERNFIRSVFASFGSLDASSVFVERFKSCFPNHRQERIFNLVFIKSGRYGRVFVAISYPHGNGIFYTVGPISLYRLQIYIRGNWFVNIWRKSKMQIKWIFLKKPCSTVFESINFPRGPNGFVSIRIRWAEHGVVSVILRPYFWHRNFALRARVTQICIFCREIRTTTKALFRFTQFAAQSPIDIIRTVRNGVTVVRWEGEKKEKSDVMVAHNARRIYVPMQNRGYRIPEAFCKTRSSLARIVVSPI